MKRVLSLQHSAVHHVWTVREWFGAGSFGTGWYQGVAAGPQLESAPRAVGQIIGICTLETLRSTAVS